MYAGSEEDLPQAVVQIVVTTYPGDNYGLDYYPRRAGDTVVYHERKDQGRPPSPALPREVSWIAKGLAPGMEIHIEAKDGSPDVFGSRHFVIAGGQPVAARSGRALVPAANSLGLPWDYSITLRVGNRSVGIDPTIVIKNDP